MIEVKSTLNGKLNASIVKEYPELEEITITPTLEGKELEPSKYGYSKVIINAIPATDVTVAPSEEQQNLKGIFKEININPIRVEEITTDLDFGTSDAIELSGQEGTYIKKATINKPTNLVPENIKSGETVCGISGINADTSDADATSDDIIAGKTAYVSNEKISGTYIPLDTSDATATAEDIAKDKTAYVNGEKITGTFEPTSGGGNNALLDASGETSLKIAKMLVSLDNIDTSSITNMNSAFSGCTKLISIPAFNTSNVTSMNYMFKGCSVLPTIPFIDTSKVTSMTNMFYECYELKSVPALDTSNVQDMSNMFTNCNSLQTVPVFNMSKVANLYNMFQNCNDLSNDSLNNIMQSCISATSYTSTKTLNYLGIDSTLQNRCKNLSNYQAFLDAGWKLS